MSLQLNDLNTAFQNYKQSDKDYFLFLAQTESVKHFAIYPQTIASIGRSVGIIRLEIDQALKRYRTALQPSTITPKGRTIEPRLLKSDISIDPVLLWHTYIGERMKTASMGAYGSSSSVESERRGGFPAFLNAFVQNAIREELEISLWWGFEDTSKEDFLSLFNGLSYHISEAIANGSITSNQILDGAYTPNTTVQYVEDLFNLVPSKWKNKPLKLFCSPEFYLDYMRDYRSDFSGMNGFDRTVNIANIDGTLCEFAPVSGLADSERVIITPMENIRVLIPEQFEMPSQVHGRELLFLPSFDSGINFVDPQLIYCGRFGLLAPTFGFSDIASTTATVNVLNAPYALAYELQISESNTFAVATTVNSASGEIDLTSLVADTEYFVRVRSKRGNDMSRFSAPQSFNTLP